MAEWPRERLITPEYQEILQKTHEQLPNFGHAGNKAKPYVEELCKELWSEDVLDYGCGKALLAKHLRFPIQNYDPGMLQYSRLPRPADIVVCRDVLEHVEESCIEAVLDHLRTLIKKVGWFIIVFKASKEELVDGKNAHMLQRDWDWWQPELEKRWKIRDFRLSSKKEVMVWVERPRVEGRFA